jgi:diguanylate cyclase (GGDEF)-like protein/PAS domain S-box-containing protein
VPTSTDPDLPADVARLLFDEAPVAVYVSDPGGVVRKVNEAFCTFLGRPAAELVRQDSQAFTWLDDVAESMAARRALANGKQRSVTVEKRYVRGDGSIATGVTTMRLDRDPAGEPLILAYVQDVTARRQAEDRLRRDALRDRLTGLANRALFLDRLYHACRRGVPGAVVALGIDRFRAVREHFSHQDGERALYELAMQLQAAAGGEENVGRIGGDEFVAVVLGEDVAAAVARLRDAMAIDVGKGGGVVLRASAGVRTIEAGESPDRILADAVIALYRAKEGVGDAVVTYTPELRGRVSRHQRIELGLRRALENGEIAPRYHGVHRAHDGALVGFEALAYWQHPELGLVPPNEFVPVAEAHGLVGRLGERILADAVTQLAEWKRGDLAISVNLSTYQLRDAEHVRALLSEIDVSGITPVRVNFEVTERVFSSLDDSVRASLDALRSTGARLVLDDFGTGFSSLHYLQDLPFDGIKVDRTFIARVSTRARDRALVRGVARLGRDLGLLCTAEGVESQEQREFLSLAGFEHLQGWYFDRPVPAGEVVV